MTLPRPICQNYPAPPTHPRNPSERTHDGGRRARTLTDTDHGTRSSHHPVQRGIADSARLNRDQRERTAARGLSGYECLESGGRLSSMTVSEGRRPPGSSITRHRSSAKRAGQNPSVGCPVERGQLGADRVIASGCSLWPVTSARCAAFRRPCISGRGRPAVTRSARPATRSGFSRWRAPGRPESPCGRPAARPGLRPRPAGTVRAACRCRP